MRNYVSIYAASTKLTFHGVRYGLNFSQQKNYMWPFRSYLRKPKVSYNITLVGYKKAQFALMQMISYNPFGEYSWAPPTVREASLLRVPEEDRAEAVVADAV